jgi:eukaryotic-like serine/threonine-protein kinase
MELNVQMEHSTDCPAEDALGNFLNGLLSDADLETMAGHLESCPDCRSSLRGIQKRLSTDRLAGQIKRCMEIEISTPHESAYAALEHAAMDLVESTEATPRLWPEAPGMVGQVVGPFLLLAQVGQGGMGVVYRARKVGQEQIVALKLVHGGAQAGHEARVRFRNEGAAVARLQHPNVVQFYEFGESGGQPYCAMEWVGGGTLTRRLGGKPMPPREAAELLKTLALAVEYAHGQKVIHRDLKPENVLLTEDGQPKISDFGLAKILDDGGEGPTLSGMVLGTPSYMAPEQAGGQLRKIGPATDVYALGAILYKCLTGQVPFKGSNRSETMHMVQTFEPEPPSRRTPGVPLGLEAICLKCLEKAPERRYVSARALADDLDRWLRSGRPSAVPSLIARCFRGVGRRWKLVAAALLVVSFVSAVAAALHLRDPDRPLRAIEADLRAGKTVTLIGENGRPVWHRWRIGGAGAQTSLASDKTFTLQSWTQAYLELLPDPQTDHYRIRAQARHSRGDRPCEVALYVCGQSYPGGTHGDVSLVTQLAFNDMNAPEVPKLPGARPRGNPVQLSQRLFTEEGTAGAFTYRIPLVNGPSVPPTGGGEQVWRDIAITVTPTKITGEWDVTSFSMEVPKAQKAIDEALSLAQRKQFPNDEVFQNLAPRILPRGGVGLAVLKGVASFRRVTVEPLPPPP